MALCASAILKKRRVLQKYYSEMNSANAARNLAGNAENYALAQLYVPAVYGAEIIFINLRKRKAHRHMTDNGDFMLL